MQAEVAKRIVTAEDLQKRKAGQGGQGRSSPDKRLRTGEVADRRGTSAKVAQRRSSWTKKRGLLLHLPTHLSIHSSVRSPICWFIDSFVCCFNDVLCFFGSLIHCFVDSLLHCKLYKNIHWFIDSWFFIIDSMIHCLIASLIHWFIGSLCHCSFSFTDSSAHWFIDSLIHGFISSLVHWFVGLFIYWLLGPLVRWCVIESSIYWSSVHWFVVSCNHWFIDSRVSLIHIDSWFMLRCFIDPWLIDWLIDWSIPGFIGSLLRSFIGSLFHWFMQLCMGFFVSFHWHLSHHLLILWCTWQLQHFVASAFQKLSYKAIFFLQWFKNVRNLGVGAGRALPGRL